MYPDDLSTGEFRLDHLSDADSGRQPSESGFLWTSIALAAGVIAASGLLLSSLSFADDSEVEALGTQRDSLVDVYCPKCDGFEDRRLEVLKDETGAMKALRFSKIAGDVQTDLIGPQTVKEKVVPMYEQSGHTLIELDARRVNPEKGGPAVMTWTKNVLFGSQDSIKFEVSQDETGDWGIEHQGHRIRRLIVTPGTVGVSDVVPQ
jgi:hypothetical protein